MPSALRPHGCGGARKPKLVHRPTGREASLSVSGIRRTRYPTFCSSRTCLISAFLLECAPGSANEGPALPPLSCSLLPAQEVIDDFRFLIVAIDNPSKNQNQRSRHGSR